MMLNRLLYLLAVVVVLSIIFFAPALADKPPPCDPEIEECPGKHKAKGQCDPAEDETCKPKGPKSPKDPG